MRILLSTIGSRGDVQPLVALALQLRACGHQAHICAPPDFGDLIGSFGFPFVPIGPSVRYTASSKAAPTLTRPSPERMRQIAEATVATQFEVMPAAAEGCDVLVGGGALQLALRSVAEQRGLPYRYVSYCPVTLPSAHHAPPRWVGDVPESDSADNTELWAADAQRWNESWGIALNAHRAATGLPAVDDVRSHIFTGRPWLAADPSLASWPETPDLEVVQTGAWIVPDRRPLPPDVKTFLDTGEPPIYFGFGSIRAPAGLAEKMIQAARSLGRRAIVSRGWTGLSPLDGTSDWLSIGDINQQALFPRVAAVVHHGGAGTTTAATRAGTAQVVIPQHYDQHYWAQRILDLGIGSAHYPGASGAESLAEALDSLFQTDIAARAEMFAASVRTDGTEVAVRELLTAV